MNNLFSIAIVVSRFNQDITMALKDGALDELKQIGISSDRVKIYEVPGAVEIPLIAQQLAKKQQVKAIIALGAVIRGETDHYHYVCEQVSQGCQRVSLDYDLPVIFGLLTTNTEEQAWDRIGGKEGHKGREAVTCAMEMIGLMNKLNEG